MQKCGDCKPKRTPQNFRRPRTDPTLTQASGSRPRTQPQPRQSARSIGPDLHVVDLRWASNAPSEGTNTTAASTTTGASAASSELIDLAEAAQDIVPPGNLPQEYFTEAGITTATTADVVVWTARLRRPRPSVIPAPAFTARRGSQQKVFQF